MLCQGTKLVETKEVVVLEAASVAFALNQVLVLNKSIEIRFLLYILIVFYIFEGPSLLADQE